MVITRRIFAALALLFLIAPSYAEPAHGTIQVAPKYPQAKKKMVERALQFDPSSPAWKQAESSAQVSLELSDVLRSKMYTLLLDGYERPATPSTVAASTAPSEGASFFDKGLRNQTRLRREAGEDGFYNDVPDYNDLYRDCGPVAPSGGVAPVPFTQQYSNGGYGAPALYPAR